MSKYTTSLGDTFDSISRKKYGSDRYAGVISAANSGALEPLTAGTELVIPALVGAPSDRPSVLPAVDKSEVAVLIDGVRFRFWSALRINRALDGIDTVEFSAPFDANAEGFKETFRPFSYKSLHVSVGGTILFSGTLVGVTPNISDQQKTVEISAYAVPGVLNDCTAPAGAFPLEFDGQALHEIATSLAHPFGIPVVFSTEYGAAFERVAVDPTEPVLAFLSELARQRGMVVSSTSYGALLFQKSTPIGDPVAVLTQGSSPLVSVSSSFSPQQYYSHITGLESVYTGTAGSQYTVKNPHLAGELRPLTFKSPDVEGGDLQQAVAAKIGRMYANMASYSVAVNTWRDAKGRLWAPNTTLKLTAPDAMIYDEYEFIIRSIVFERDGKKESAQLDLVLPESFNGGAPESLPWD